MCCPCIVTLHWITKQQSLQPLLLRPLPLPQHSQKLLLGVMMGLLGSL